MHRQTKKNKKMVKKKRTEIEKFVLPQPTKEPQIDYKQSKQKRRGKKKDKKAKGTAC